METQAKSEVVHLRLPVEVIKRVREIAKREERTQANVMIRALREGLKASGNGKS